MRNKYINQATGAHFNEPGHGIEHIQIIAIKNLKTKTLNIEKKKKSFSHNNLTLSIMV